MSWEKIAGLVIGFGGLFVTMLGVIVTGIGVIAALDSAKTASKALTVQAQQTEIAAEALAIQLRSPRLWLAVIDERISAEGSEAVIQTSLLLKNTGEATATDVELSVKGLLSQGTEFRLNPALRATPSRNKDVGYLSLGNIGGDSAAIRIEVLERLSLAQARSSKTAVNYDIHVRCDEGQQDQEKVESTYPQLPGGLDEVFGLPPEVSRLKIKAAAMSWGS